MTSFISRVLPLAYVVVTLFLAVAAKADPVDCTEGGRDQYSINACAGLAAAETEKLLSEVLQYMARFDKEKWAIESGRAKARLKAQAAWVAYREAQCDYEEGDGTMSSMRYSNCMRYMAVSRIRQLLADDCSDGGPGECPEKESFLKRLEKPNQPLEPTR